MTLVPQRQAKISHPMARNSVVIYRSWNSDVTRTTAKETEKAVIGDTGDTRDGTSSFMNSIHEVSIGNS
ncbi:hypothetical protein DPMN_053325, partial [Dreissena polymorpha]